MYNYCGLDFGTSNSTVGVKTNTGFQLANLENYTPIIPTTVFFDYDEKQQLFGKAALERYVDGEEGRLLRAIKSVLGNDLMYENTIINGRQMPLKNIIGLILKHLKTQAEQHVGHTLDQVVLGRPVHFNDHTPEKDQAAEDLLKKIALQQGFKEVEFQFEPIAAAYSFEQQEVKQETLALIVDIGGGTSDFSVLRLGTGKVDRREDILANGGIHIGGTDFDRKFNMKEVMPHLGKETKIKTDMGKTLSIPVSYFADMATWHRINFLYHIHTREKFEEYLDQAISPHTLHRFFTLLDYELGHMLNMQVEQQKQFLSQRKLSTLELDFIEKNLCVELTQKGFYAAIHEELNKLSRETETVIKEAGIAAHDIDVLFFTGGSTKIPLLRDRVSAVVPAAQIVEGDAFGSVGYGLAVDAFHRFS